MTESEPKQDAAPISYDAVLRPCFERIKAQLSARKHAKLQEDLESLLEKLSVFLLDADDVNATEFGAQNGEDLGAGGEQETSSTTEDGGRSGHRPTEEDEIVSSDAQRRETVVEGNENQGTKSSDSGHMHSSVRDTGKHRKMGALPDGAALGERQSYVCAEISHLMCAMSFFLLRLFELCQFISILVRQKSCWSFEILWTHASRLPWKQRSIVFKDLLPINLCKAPFIASNITGIPVNPTVVVLQILCNLQLSRLKCRQ